jgi:hypothetical protein
MHSKRSTAAPAAAFLLIPAAFAKKHRLSNMAPPQAKKRVLLIGASERSGSGGSLEIPGTEWQKIHR